MELNSCAFCGTTEKQHVQTIKVEGIINGCPVKILLDSRSTHNFVDSRILKQLGWHCHTTKPFDVMIKDGGNVRNQGFCRNIPLVDSGYHCAITL